MVGWYPEIVSVVSWNYVHVEVKGSLVAVLHLPGKG